MEWNVMFPSYSQPQHLVKCAPFSWHDSANYNVAMTLLRTVLLLWSSQQSTLGLPVLPARLFFHADVGGVCGLAWAVGKPSRWPQI
jgi:hypothetical protein